MNKDQIEGTVKKVDGKAERVVGNVLDNAGMEAQGMKHEADGAAQASYGHVSETVATAFDELPGSIKNAAKNVRKQARRGNREIRRRLGDYGPLYVALGAVSIAALGVFAMRNMDRSFAGFSETNDTD
jgi:uncharacterized protein YjbJ (UPF0337 family)